MIDNLNGFTLGFILVVLFVIIPLMVAKAIGKVNKDSAEQRPFENQG
jgi:hypothetical protein